MELKKDKNALAAGIVLLVCAVLCFGLGIFDLAMIVAGALGNAFAAMAGAKEAVLEAQMTVAGRGLFLKIPLFLSALAGGIAALVLSRGGGKAGKIFVAETVCASCAAVVSAAYIISALAEAGLGGLYWWNYLSAAVGAVCTALLIGSAVRARGRSKLLSAGEGKR